MTVRQGDEAKTASAEEGPIAAWVRGSPAARGSGSPCPSEEMLAGWAERRLLAAEDAAVLEHLAVCDACRGIAAELRSTQIGAAEGEVLRGRFGPRPRLVAAAALVVVGLVVWGSFAVLRKDPAGSPDSGGSLDTRSRLVAAVEASRARAPGIGALELPTLDALRSATRPVERGDGDLALLAPREVVLLTQYELVFSAPRSMLGCDVVVLDAEGRRAFEKRLESAEIEAAAALAHRWCEARGASAEPAKGDLSWRFLAIPLPDSLRGFDSGEPWTWRVVATLPGRTLEAAASFRMATTPELDAYSECRVAADRPDAGVRPLLAAHLALAYGILGDAEDNARKFLAANPADAYGRATLFAILTRLGSPEAALYR